MQRGLLIIVAFFGSFASLQAQEQPQGLPIAPLFPQPLFQRLRPTPTPNCCPVAPLYPNLQSDPNLTPPKLPTQEEIARQTPNQPNNAFASQSEGGGAAGRSFNDNFNGDFGGITITERRQVGTVSRTFFDFSQDKFVTVQDPVYQDFQVTIGGRYSGILITENDSPRPTTRAYFGANYYTGVNASLNPELGNTTMTRQTMGFEYAFWNNTASVGMRLPFIQTDAPLGLGGNSVGDLSLLFKYAFYNRPNGDLLSVGLVLTIPTGTKILLSDGSELPTSVLYQPWVGGVKMFERGYLQGISSLLIPTNPAEPTLINNSFSAAYFLYRNDSARFIKMISPAIECHIRTPLDNRDPNGLIYVQDQVNITTALHFRSERFTVSPAFSVPLVNPKPWNYEAMVWVNMRF